MCERLGKRGEQQLDAEPSLPLARPAPVIRRLIVVYITDRWGLDDKKDYSQVVKWREGMRIGDVFGATSYKGHKGHQFFIERFLDARKMTEISSDHPVEKGGVYAIEGREGTFTIQLKVDDGELKQMSVPRSLQICNLGRSQGVPMGSVAIWHPISGYSSLSEGAATNYTAPTNHTVATNRKTSNQTADERTAGNGTNIERVLLKLEQMEAANKQERAELRDRLQRMEDEHKTERAGLLATIGKLEERIAGLHHVNVSIAPTPLYTCEPKPRPEPLTTGQAVGIIVGLAFVLCVFVGILLSPFCCC
ncbi:hypothetical protein M3Y99_00573100 [Aphelenchoides fujianensis]|nr:hypothetical protein M3Y99_00573100 [Aphelenchoides fujianensis]